MQVLSGPMAKKDSSSHAVRPGGHKAGMKPSGGPQERRLGQTRWKIHSRLHHKDFEALLGAVALGEYV